MESHAPGSPAPMWMAGWPRAGDSAPPNLAFLVCKMYGGVGVQRGHTPQQRLPVRFGSPGVKRKRNKGQARRPSLGSALPRCVSSVGLFTSLGLRVLPGQMRAVKAVMARTAQPSSPVGAQCPLALLNFLKRFSAPGSWLPKGSYSQFRFADKARRCGQEVCSRSPCWLESARGRDFEV